MPVFERGDIVNVPLDPALGHEQKGTRPALVLTTPRSRQTWQARQPCVWQNARALRADDVWQCRCRYWYPAGNARPLKRLALLRRGVFAAITHKIIGKGLQTVKNGFGTYGLLA